MAQIHSTQTSGDIAINITSFKRNLTVTNKNPKTIKCCLEVSTELAQFVKERDHAAEPGRLRCEHFEQYIADQLE